VIPVLFVEGLAVVSVTVRRGRALRDTTASSNVFENSFHAKAGHGYAVQT